MQFRIDGFPVSPEWSDPDLEIPVVKWLRPGRAIQLIDHGFWVSPKGTWGRGVYVAAAHTPLSAAHHGQAAVWARLRLGRVFDATIPENARAFMKWADLPEHPSPWLLPGSRSSDADNFKRVLVPQPDSIAFCPDEWNPHTRNLDVWFLVWSPRYDEATSDVNLALDRFRGTKLFLGVSERFDRRVMDTGSYIQVGGRAEYAEDQFRVGE